MTNPPLIGLSGYARSGKDTAAAGLLEAGWERRSFADRIRELAYGTNPVVMHQGQQYRLARLVDAYGWEYVKDTYAEAREFLQRLGGVARDVLGVNVWVDAAVRCMDPAAPVVFTDCRFQSEADEIRSRGGLVVRLYRPGVGPAVAADGTIHISETALDGYDFDHVVVNDGTPHDLHRMISAIVGLRWSSAPRG